MARATTALWLAAALAACGPRASAPTAAPAPPPLIARADLFGEPVRQNAQLAPRGDRVAFLAPRDGVTNLFVMPVDSSGEPQPVTDDRGRGIRTYWWAHDNATLLYLQDDNGDENWRLYAVPAAGGEARPLTPAGARAEVLGVSAADPVGVVISLNARDAQWPDVFRVDITSGARTLMQRNSNSAAARGFSSFSVDLANRLRLGTKNLPDGSVDILARPAQGGAWTSLFTIPFEDAMGSRVLGFEADGRTFLMLDSTGRDRAALVRVDAQSGVKTVLGESARADVADAWLDPQTNAPEAFAADYLRRDWRALDPDAQADLDFLDAQLNGDFHVVSRSVDDARWIVVEEGPAIASRSYLYDRSDRANRRMSLLFRSRPALDQVALQPMTPVEIEARDGLTLVSYLTLPIGSDENGDARPDAPVPLVLLPHDGPWARDTYGYNALHQWLANRGYAVLSVNFRGSSGFGKAFLNAGNREWGAKIQEDLIDAAQWAVQSGVAQAERVGVFGAGFGGYAALAGLAFAPDQFQCGVSLAGASNLTSMFEALPAFTTPMRDQLYLRVGDARTADGRQVLRERSPAARVNQMRQPLLLAAGARDPRGSRADADALATTLRARRAPLTFVVFPDEGRELVRPQNRLSFLAIAEHFLSQCLGGRTEPVGAAFEGARLEAFDGAANVPGLTAFARRTPTPAASENAPGESPAVAPVETDGSGGPELVTSPPADATGSTPP
ncbi:dipeptidyl anminopeptidase [alpha proteobacterium U9-1i]|nr:dipeptidyl anminopeptidase [alpha proteobacterium U9-1i]